MEKPEIPSAVPFRPSLAHVAQRAQGDENATTQVWYRSSPVSISTHVVQFLISLPVAFGFFFMAVFASDPGTAESAKASQTLMLASFLSLLWGVVGNWCILYIAVASLFVAMLASTKLPLVLWDVYGVGILLAAACLTACQFRLVERVQACLAARRAEATTTNDPVETSYTQELMT